MHRVFYFSEIPVAGNETGAVRVAATSGGLRVEISDTGSFKEVLSTDERVTVSGAAAALTKELAAVTAPADKAVGPRDLFTRPWRPGDRNPTEGEQMFDTQGWFKDFGKDQPQPGTVPGSGPSRTVAAVMGGETPLVYPNRSQAQTRVTGVTAGLTAYSFIIPKGDRGVGRVSIAQESGGDASGEFAVATEMGPVVGPSVKVTYEGNMPVFNFQVGQNEPGYGPELPTEVKIYINAKYKGNPGSNQLVQLEAHNRPQ